MTNFTNLNLNEKILNALEKKGYSIPTDIQRQAIPHILEGKDILGIAQTGTGKTAAFSLPILHNLAKNTVSVKSGGVRVLILTPTRELASQIADNIELYGKELGLRYAVIFGGVSERPQITAIQRGVDILIATPGRLLDLTSQGYIRYMQLEVLVLDEADRMLDMGFINDIKKIIQKIPEKRQTLFFSATMPSTIIGLANSILKSPIKVEVTPQATTVERIDQKVLFVEKSHKLSLLKNILKDENMTSALVFCKTKHGANKVVEFLEKNNISVSAIHGNKSQGAREKALASFRAAEIKVLVATDIAARGIDIPAISHVINYDIPLDPESYVHRIGRTARAGLKGIAISLCDSTETRFLREVEKTIKLKIPVDESHPFHGVEPAPMQRISRGVNSSEENSHSSNRAPRKYGFEANKARKISASSSDDRRRPGTRRDDDRRPSRTRQDSDSFSSSGTKRREDDRGFNRNRSDERVESRNSNYRKDSSRPESRREGGKPDKKLFGIFSFGQKNQSEKRDDRSPRNESRNFGNSSDDRKPRSSRTSDSRFKEESSKKTSFGFGWFKNKKSDKGEKRLDPNLEGRKRSDNHSGNKSSTGPRNFSSASRSSRSGPNHRVTGGARNGKK